MTAQVKIKHHSHHHATKHKKLHDSDVVDYSKTVVAHCPPEISRPFRIALFATLFIQISVTLSLVYSASRFTAVANVLYQHLWLLIPPLFLLGIIMLAYFLGMSSHFSIRSSFMLVIISTFTTSFILGFLASFVDPTTVLRVILLSLIVTTFLFLYSLQTVFNYSPFVAAVLGLVITGGCIVGLVFIPFRKRFDHPEIRMFLNPPNNELTTIITFLIFIILMVFLLYYQRVLEEKLYPNEYFFASFHLHLDFVFLLVFVVKVSFGACIPTRFWKSAAR